MANPKTIKIDEVEYVRMDSIEAKAESLNGMDYVIIRGDRSGVFAGYLESRKDREVIIRECRRLWYWDGASSLSQLSVDGVSKPGTCKFPVAVEKAEILDVIEVIPATEKARKSIECVGVWKQ